MEDAQSLLNEPERDDAAEAFARLEVRVAELEERLEGRLALMTRTLEHIALERQSLDLPDYGPTLAKMNGHLASIVGQTRAMQESPALKLTPKSMAAEIAAAATTARDADKAMIGKALDLHRQAHADIVRAVGQVRTKADQRRHAIFHIAGTALTISLLWLIYPAWAAGIGPQGWLWPERLARRTLGESTLWNAGVRLMRAGDMQAWEAIVKATDLVRDNRQSISDCERVATKTNTATRCSISVDPIS